jgi:hypothetical protein
MLAKHFAMEGQNTNKPIRAVSLKTKLLSTNIAGENIQNFLTNITV